MMKRKRLIVASLFVFVCAGMGMWFGIASAGPLGNFASRFSNQMDGLRNFGGRSANTARSSSVMQMDSIGEPASCTSDIIGNRIVGGDLCVPYGVVGEGEGEEETRAGVFIGGATEGSDGIYLVKEPDSTSTAPDPVIDLKGASPEIGFFDGNGKLAFYMGGEIAFSNNSGNINFNDSGGINFAGIGDINFFDSGDINFYDSGDIYFTESGSIMFFDTGFPQGSVLAGGLGSTLEELNAFDPDDFYTVLSSCGPLLEQAPGGMLVLGTLRDNAEPPNTPNTLSSGAALVALAGNIDAQVVATLALTPDVIGGEGEGEGENVGRAEISIYNGDSYPAEEALATLSLAPAANLINESVKAGISLTAAKGEGEGESEFVMGAYGLIHAYSATGGRLTLGDNGGDVLLEATQAAQGAKIEATHDGDVIIHLGSSE